eukprot:SM000001S04453  [mRNA]  locus=s1:325005:326771:+ [translate_table: standard]
MDGAGALRLPRRMDGPFAGSVGSPMAQAATAVGGQLKQHAATVAGAAAVMAGDLARHHGHDNWYFTMQIIVCITAAFLLFVDRTHWRSDMLTALLVPVIFLTLPHHAVHWLRGEPGHWIVFICTVIWLFIPQTVPRDWLLHGELPYVLLILLIISPSRVLELRNTPYGIVIIFLVGVYLFYEHIVASEGVRNAFNNQRAAISIALTILLIVPAIMLGHSLSWY